MSYRIPLFDKLESNLKDNKFKVIGNYRSGGIFGKFNPRKYSIHFNAIPIINSIFSKALLKVWKDKADIVVTEASPRNTILLIYLCLFKRQNTIHIGWSKVSTSKNYKGIFKYLYKNYCSYFYNKFEHLFVYGKESEKDLLKMHFNPKKISVIQNSIEVAYSNLSHNEINNALEKYKLLNNRKKILVLGRMDDDKRPLDILMIWERLSSRYQDLDLYFAGDGPLIKEIKKEISEKKLKQVMVIGKFDKGIDNLLIENCTICLQQGAVGLAINQSMLLKTSVIVADEKGPDSELIIQKETGLRYEKGNKNKLYKAIVKVLDDNSLRERMIKNANLKVNKLATVDKMVDTMLNKFKLLMNE